MKLPTIATTFFAFFGAELCSLQIMLGGGHINSDMQQFLENDKKAFPGASGEDVKKGLDKKEATNVKLNFGRFE